jgi:Ser/Thr protein kinase RdoA (MazF antagonist)
MSGQRGVALEALRRHDVAPQKVTLAAESFNSIFRVATASAVYALRVGSALQIHPEGTSAVEAAWHRRLRQHGVCVPDVLANVDGELATVVTDGRAEHGSRTCVLFDWVAGRSLRTCMTGRQSAALGRLSARLQQDAVAWSPSGAGEVLLADRVLYWRLPEQLSAAGSRFGFGTLFLDALARAQSVVDSLWRSPPHPPHLVHGDLTPANVIVSPRSGLVPIDFQDTVRGFEVQDLSITGPVRGADRRPGPAPDEPHAEHDRHRRAGKLRGRSCRASSRLDAVLCRPVARTARTPASARLRERQVASLPRRGLSACLAGVTGTQGTRRSRQIRALPRRDSYG